MTKLFKKTISQLGRIAQSATGRGREPSNSAKDTSPLPVPTEITRHSAMPEGECIYAVGDIHGRADLLLQLIEIIEKDAAMLPAGTDIKLVFLGDYIDRGLQSRQVVDLFLGPRLAGVETIYLMGNHEEALLNFLQDASFGEQWAQYGGAETLYSYGFQPPPPRGSDSPDAQAMSQNAWATLWNAFRAKLPEDHLNFYQGLDTHYLRGDYVFVHAGLRPGLPVEHQSPTDMMWIRDEFLQHTGIFTQVVVHGHTPEAKIYRDNRRIGLDTGAYLSGRLSAAKFHGEDVAYLTT
jgi:serine/threonine protein phosphatase 1